MLYDGTVITGWPVLYSEGITAFDKVRGFDMVVCAEPAAYKTISAACGDVPGLRGDPGLRGLPDLLLLRREGTPRWCS